MATIPAQIVVAAIPVTFAVFVVVFFIIANKIREWGRKVILNRIKKVLYPVFLTLGRPLPFSLRKFYIQEVSIKAASSYTPPTYQGKVILFRVLLIALILPKC